MLFPYPLDNWTAGAGADQWWHSRWETWWHTHIPPRFMFIFGGIGLFDGLHFGVQVHTFGFVCLCPRVQHGRDLGADASEGKRRRLQGRPHSQTKRPSAV